MENVKKLKKNNATKSSNCKCGISSSQSDTDTKLNHMYAKLSNQMIEMEENIRLQMDKQNDNIIKTMVDLSETQMTHVSASDCVIIEHAQEVIKEVEKTTRKKICNAFILGLIVFFVLELIKYGIKFI